MDKKLLPGNYAWHELNNEWKEAVIMTYHREMSAIGFRFSIGQVRDIFMEAMPVIVVGKESECSVHLISKPAMEYFIALEFHNSK